MCVSGTQTFPDLARHFKTCIGVTVSWSMQNCWNIQSMPGVARIRRWLTRQWFFTIFLVLRLRRRQHRWDVITHRATVGMVFTFFLSWGYTKNLSFRLLMNRFHLTRAVLAFSGNLTFWRRNLGFSIIAPSEIVVPWSPHLADLFVFPTALTPLSASRLQRLNCAIGTSNQSDSLGGRLVKPNRECLSISGDPNVLFLSAWTYWFRSSAEFHAREVLYSTGSSLLEL